MGFGFNLIAFPVVLFTFIILLILYFLSNERKYLIGLFVLCGGLSMLFGVVSYINHSNRPIKLQKKDIVGLYQIDTSFYPGKNAKWQHKHFKFRITKDDSFIFSIKSNSGKTTNLRGKVLWRLGPPDLWTIKMNGSSHHILQSPPTLYRGHDRFYYVFESDWGNVFFRKVN